MTNRLQKLRQEQERIKRALANDPRWVSLVGSLRTNSTGSRLAGLDPKAVGVLAKHELFTAYVAVTRAIEELQAPELPTPSDPPAAETEEPAKPFRTRVTVKPSSSAKVSEGDNGYEDDLTAIRGIDRKMAGALNELGVRTYQAIAEWDRHEVRRVRDALQLDKRIWRENWIEQAALLRLRQLDEPAPVVASAPMSAPAIVAAPAQTEDNPSDEQMVAEGDTQEAHVVVGAPAAGVAIVAAATVSALPQSVEAAASSEQPAKEEVVEAPASDPLPPTELIGPTGTLAETDPTPLAAEPQPAPTNMIKVGRRPQRLPAPAARRFAYLSGVSDEMSESLRSVGVKSLADIAAWSRADVRWFQALLGEGARISRDQWIEQATLLSKGIWTAYALRVVRGETRALVGAPDSISPGVPAMRGAPLPTEDVVETFDAVETTAAPTFVDTEDGSVLVEPPLELQEDNAQEITERATSSEPDDAAVAATPPELAVQDGDDVSSPAAPRKDANRLRSDFAPVTMRAKLPPTARFDPMRGLSTAIALGKLRRPPPDLGEGKKPKPAVPAPAPVPTPEPSAEPVSKATGVIPPVRLEPPSEVFDDAADDRPSDVDDWDDAEALVIKRGPAVQPMPGEFPAPIASADVPLVDDSGPLAHDDDDWENATPWRDEADVVIVSKPRSDAGVPTATPRPRPESATERARRQLGLTSSAEMATGQQPLAPGGAGSDVSYGSFGDTTEEAMVTIIRAEASEESASSIMPNDIANDVSGPDQHQTETDGRDKPRVRAIGSRFLKALTGD